MKLNLTFPHAGIEGTLKFTDAAGDELDAVYDAEGNEVKITGAVWTPEFLIPDARPYALFLETKDKHGKMIHRSVASLSGRTGHVKLHDRTQPVEAQIYAKVKKEGKEK